MSRNQRRKLRRTQRWMRADKKMSSTPKKQIPLAPEEVIDEMG
jgi:hypothetical protein